VDAEASEEEEGNKHHEHETQMGWSVRPLKPSLEREMGLDERRIRQLAAHNDTSQRGHISPMSKKRGRHRGEDEDEAQRIATGTKIASTMGASKMQTSKQKGEGDVNERLTLQLPT
jgi:hypothetical protein